MKASSFDPFADRRSRVERRLDELVPASAPDDRITASIRHSLLAPAKRVRGVLALTATRELGGKESDTLDAACAIEMVHAASLILDDLPAMDNAQVRRGLPANHRVFGEATAVLAAIGLLNCAYSVVANTSSLGAAQRVSLTDVLSWSIGLDGLVRGQADDLADSRALLTDTELERMYARKTGALFAAAAECGAVLADRYELRGSMRRFGLDLGIGFQVLDDVLDAAGTAEQAGKDVALDANRATFVSVLGLKEAAAFGQRKIQSAVSQAQEAAQSAGGDGRQFVLFAARLAGAFSDIMPELGAQLAVHG